MALSSREIADILNDSDGDWGEDSDDSWDLSSDSDESEKSDDELMDNGGGNGDGHGDGDGDGQDFGDEDEQDEGDENGQENSDEDGQDDDGNGGGQGDGNRGRPRTGRAPNLWRDITGKNEVPPHIPFISERETFAPELSNCASEADFFQLIFSNELLIDIVNETNRYANEKTDKLSPLKPNSQWKGWENVTLVEFKAFLGVIMNMAINDKPSMSDYFSRDWLTKQDFFGDVCTRWRFFQIYRALHVCPPAPPGSSKLATRGQKIKNVADYIESKCREYYSPGENVAVDESTAGFKGRTEFKMYNPQKPTKWGLRVYVLAESATGYVAAFEPYFGSATTASLVEPGKPFTERIVLHLVSRLMTDCPAQGRHLYTDRFYSSLDLGTRLLEDKIHHTGTIMPNRKNLPAEVKKGQLGKMRKGDFRAFRQGDTVVVAWKDKRAIVMTSTYHGDEVLEIQRRKLGGQLETIKKPKVTADYTANMGAVDRADHFFASYNFCRKTLKWWVKLFFWLLEVAIVNAYLLFNAMQGKRGKKALTHIAFRRQLIRQLVEGHTSLSPPKRKRPRSDQGDLERMNGLFHIFRKGKKSDCAVCSDRTPGGTRHETRYYCDTCPSKPHLCLEPCYEKYHTMKKFK